MTAPFWDPWWGEEAGDDPADVWLFVPIVDVELPPFDESSGVPVLRDGGAQ